MSESSASPFGFLRRSPTARIAPRPVNVFEISGFPRWETVASNVLGYFFDPNERHGLGTLFIDGLLGLLDGARLVGPRGLEESRLRADKYLHSTEWKVVTEQATSDHMRIDVYLTNDALKLAIIIENKLDAIVDNPFESYARHALEKYPTTVSVVIAPTQRLMSTPDGMSGWTSDSITYDQFFDVIQDGLHPSFGEPRSLDLLAQFIDNTSERSKKMDDQEEALALSEFWDAVRGSENEFVSFFGALDRVNQILKGRAGRLRSLVAERLDARGIQIDDQFIVAGIDHRWGRSEGLVAIVYLGFHLQLGPGIELMLGFDPARRSYQLTVKAYANRAKPNNCLANFDHVPLGVEYSAADDVVVDKFIEFVDALVPAKAHGL